MSNLLSSIVRGFGFTVGRRAANSLIDGVSTRNVQYVSTPVEVVQPAINVTENVKLTNSQKIVSFVIHFLIVFILFFVSQKLEHPFLLISLLFSFAYFLMGWMIPVSYFSDINQKKQIPFIRQKLYDEIDSLVNALKQTPLAGWSNAPINPSGRYDKDWTMIRNYPIHHLHTMIHSYKRILGFIDKNVDEYGIEKFKEIVSQSEPEIGMSERDFGLWKIYNNSLLDSFRDVFKYLSYPTDVEETVKNGVFYKTLIYGNKRTGSYYKFKDGVLQSFTQRD